MHLAYTSLWLLQIKCAIRNPFSWKSLEVFYKYDLIAFFFNDIVNKGGILGNCTGIWQSNNDVRLDHGLTETEAEDHERLPFAGKFFLYQKTGCGLRIKGTALYLKEV